MSNTFFFSEDHAVYEIMWKSWQSERPQTKILYGAEKCACMPDNYDTNAARLILVNTYCFSTATMVTRMRLTVTLYVHYLSCFI